MTLAVIPARGGSKGIPRKNLRTLGGKPLIAWTIEAALAANGVSRVVVSTDDEEIAEVAQSWGADVPFMRPPELATDEASGFAPVLHAMAQLPDYADLLLLQPTSPFRGTREIDDFLTFARVSGASSAVSLSPVSEHPAWMFERHDAGQLVPLLQTHSGDRRQDLAPLYILNGAMYWGAYSWLADKRSFVGEDTRGFVMEAATALDIDDMSDWAFAEFLLVNAPETGGTGHFVG